MGFFRRRLSKPKEPCTLKEPYDGEMSERQPLLHDSSPPPRPPPPSHTDQPLQPRAAAPGRDQPSSPLRYQRKDGSLPPMSSQSDSAKSTRRSRKPTFKEMLDEDANVAHHRSSASSRPLPSPDAALSQRPVQTVDGIAFNMLRSSKSSPASTTPSNARRSRSSPNERDDRRQADKRDRRQTRSETRRHARADSLTPAASGQSVTKNVASSAEPSQSDNPPPLNIRKTTSDTKATEEFNAAAQTPTKRSPAQSSMLSPIRRSPTVPLSAPPSPTPSSESPIFKSSPTSKQVLVAPPVYSPIDMNSSHWLSPLSSTSRPREPWAWPKRWTCCKCEAETIVEQKVCSKIRCGHVRCGDECRLARRL